MLNKDWTPTTKLWNWNLHIARTSHACITVSASWNELVNLEICSFTKYSAVFLLKSMQELSSCVRWVKNWTYKAGRKCCQVCRQFSVLTLLSVWLKWLTPDAKFWKTQNVKCSENTAWQFNFSSGGQLKLFVQHAIALFDYMFFFFSLQTCQLDVFITMQKWLMTNLVCN